MHIIQQKILDLSKKKDISRLSYRELGKQIGIEYAQQVKHHLQQLIKNGYIDSDRTVNYLDSLRAARNLQPNIISVPLIGSANCGKATFIAENRIEGYLKISSSMLPKTDGIFALRAVGNSMNLANIKGQSIDDGDFVIVDYKQKVPKNGDYVVSIIENCANIKKYYADQRVKQVRLISESSENHLPIIINSDDYFMINGKVIAVIKN